MKLSNAFFVQKSNIKTVVNVQKVRSTVWLLFESKMQSISLSALATLFFVVVGIQNSFIIKSRNFTNSNILFDKLVSADPSSSSSAPKFTIEDGSEIENFFRPAPPVRESYECQIKALEQASLQNGMTNEWKKYEAKFKQHLDAWKKCDSLTGILNRLWYVPIH